MEKASDTTRKIQHQPSAAALSSSQTANLQVCNKSTGYRCFQHRKEYLMTASFLFLLLFTYFQGIIPDLTFQICRWKRKLVSVARNHKFMAFLTLIVSVYQNTSPGFTFPRGPPLSPVPKRGTRHCLAPRAWTTAYCLFRFLSGLKPLNCSGQWFQAVPQANFYSIA